MLAYFDVEMDLPSVSISYGDVEIARRHLASRSSDYMTRKSEVTRKLIDFVEDTVKTFKNSAKALGTSMPLYEIRYWGRTPTDYNRKFHIPKYAEFVYWDSHISTRRFPIPIHGTWYVGVMNAVMPDIKTKKIVVLDDWSI